MKVSDKGGSDFQTVDSGNYVARCYKLIDLGTQYGEYEGKPTSARKVVIGWEFPTELMDDGKPFVTSAFYTMSIGEKAKLRSILKDWRGRDFTPEELCSFELKTILGTPCMLNMVANKKGKIVPGSVSAMPKGMKCDNQINPSVYFSLDEDEFQPEVFDTLSDWFKAEIKKSPEYQALMDKLFPRQLAANHDDDSDIPF
jgi:hypothetical protein